MVSKIDSHGVAHGSEAPDSSRRQTSRVLVVDAGMLRKQELAEFLSSAPTNFAAVAQLTFVEMCQGDILNNLEPSTRILSRFPRQVLVLRGQVDLINTRGAEPLRRSDLVDPVVTEHFGWLGRGLGDALRGDLQNVQLLRIIQESVNMQQREVLQAVTTAGENFKLFREGFDKELLSRIKKRGLTTENVPQLSALIFDLTRHLLDSNPKTRGQRPPEEVLPSTLQFRIALCEFARILWWLASGGAENAKAKVHRNDAIDAIVAAFATYFDGILSRDERQKYVHGVARTLLPHFGGAVGV